MEENLHFVMIWLKYFNVFRATSVLGGYRDLEIKNPVQVAVHAFSPYLALATLTRTKSETTPKGVISVWLPKNS